jgi:hypothetical protein
LVSVTRFRLRSIRFAPFCMLHANRTIAQIRKTDGFVAGAVKRDADLVFCTLSVWRNGHAMRAYTALSVWRNAMRAYTASFAHRKAIPHVVDWADEASVGHWTQPGSDLPEWPEAVRRLREEGHPLTLFTLRRINISSPSPSRR